MELHERIDQLRKERNITQQDLADRLGVSRQAVSRWEMGTAKPEVESLTALAKVFDITVDELLTGEMPGERETPATEKQKHHLRKWLIAWAVTWLAAMIIFAVVTFVRWKFGGVLVAILPVTLIVQFINLGFDLGIAYVILYWIVKLWKK